MLAKRILHFFVFSNLFIAGCAIAMAAYSCLWLSGHSISYPALCFLFFSTICSYSFHWWLTPASTGRSSREDWLVHHRYIHFYLLIAGAIGSVVSVYYLFDDWPWLLVGAFVTFLYSAPKIPHPLFRALRKIAIGKTLFLAFMWTYATTTLPVIIDNIEWTATCSWFSINRFTLIYAICILFDLRDREYDREMGIRSLVTVLSERGVHYLFLLSLLLFFATLIPLWSVTYSLIDIIILAVPGICTASLYTYAKKRNGDLLYYLVLDGLMALSAFIYLAACWFDISL